MKKRLLSLLLTLCMLLSLMPTMGISVGAETFDKTWKVVPSDGKIKENGNYYLASDFTGAIVISGENSTAIGVTLDLNGKTLATSNNNIIAIENGSSLTLRDSSTEKTGKITTNDTTQFTRGVYIKSGNLTMEGGKIVGCNANSNNNGAGVLIVSGSFTMTGGTICDNTAAQNGGGVYVDGNAKFTMTGGEISGNKAANGGAVYYIGNDTLKIENAKIYNNSVTGQGAGIYTGKNATLTSCEIYGNTANSYGGGVRANGTNGSTITLTVDKCNIYGNKGNQGGAIKTDYTAVVVKNSEITENSSTSSGGGLQIWIGSLNMTDTKVSGNTSTGSDGGGIYCNASLTVKGGSISGNKAINGGGVLAQGGTTSITDCTISNNNASQQGAGIYTTNATTLTGCEISGNTATYFGGGVRANGNFTLNVDNCKIHDNQGSQGGGIKTDSTTVIINNSQITKNNATTYGGGMQIWNGKLTVTDTTISENTAKNNGGGFYSNTSTNVSGGTISGNTADNGGGIYADNTLNLKNTTVSGNKATNNGGGIAANGPVTVGGKTIVGDNTLSDGTANNLYLYAGKKITISEETPPTDEMSIGVTTAGYDNFTTGSEGDAKYFSSDDTDYDLEYNNTDWKLKDNSPHIHDNDTPEITSDDVTFTKLKAEGGTLQSGNYYLKDDVTLTTNITIPKDATVNICLNGHVLKGNGNGSVITNQGTLHIYDCDTETAHYYTVQSDGTWEWDDSKKEDAVELTALTAAPTEGAVVKVTGGCITGGNYTSGNFIGGGAIYCQDTTPATTLTLENVNLIGNYGQQGGALFAKNGKLEIKGGVVAGNKSTYNGGGIYGFMNSAFTVDGTKIMFNSGSGVGGGIALYETTLNINDAIVSFNTSTDNCGGGIGMMNGNSGSANANITGNTVISGNSAKNGGAGVSVDSNGSLTMDGTVIVAGNKCNGKEQNFNLPSGKKIQVAVPVANTNLIYNGTEQTGVEIAESAPYQFVTESGSTLKATDAGEYSAKVALKDTNNYVWADSTTGEKTIEWSIDTRSVTLWSETASKAYDGTALTASTVYANENKTAVDSVFASDVENLTATGSVTNVADGEVTNAISYTFKDGKSQNNYNISKTEGELSITQATNEINGLSITGWTYGGKENEPSITSATFGANEVSYQYKVKGADDATYTETVPQNAGEYTVKATIEGTTNYAGAKATAQFKIAQATVTLSDVKAQDKAYDGNTNADVKFTDAGIVEGDKVNIDFSASFADKKVGTGKTVNISFSLSGDDEDNYTLNITDTTDTATISPKALMVTGTTVKSKEYNGNATAIVENMGTLGEICEGDSVSIDTATGTFGDVNVGQEKNVTVTYTLTGEDAGNYKVEDSTVSGSITQAKNKIEGLSITDWTYGDKANEPSITGATFGADTVIYQYWDLVTKNDEGAEVWSNIVPTQAGTYNVRAFIKGTTNYADAIATKNFTIKTADINDADVTGINASYEFTGSKIEPEPVVTFKGKTLEKDVDYSVDYDSNQEPGTATVIIKGKGNFEGSEKKIDFSIAPPCTVKVSVSETTVKPLDKITVTINAENIPTGCRVVWNISGSSKWYPVEISEDGNTITLVACSYGTLKVNAKVVDANGKVVQNADNSKATDTVSVDVMLRLDNIIFKLMNIFKVLNKVLGK